MGLKSTLNTISICTFAVLSNIDAVHAVSYSIVDLGTLGGTSSYGWGINNNGQVAGYSYIAGSNVSHAFIADGSGMTDLGTLGGTHSYGWGINDSGQVVGYSSTVTGSNAAFFYDGSSMLDLCMMTDCASSGWSNFTAAYGINNNGDITGYGTIDGQQHAFLLTNISAVPVPAAVWLFGSGLLGLIGVARRKSANI